MKTRLIIASIIALTVGFVSSCSQDDGVSSPASPTASVSGNNLQQNNTAESEPDAETPASSSEAEQEPTQSTPLVCDIYDSGCLDYNHVGYVRSGDDVSRFEMKWSGTTAECSFINLEYFCDFMSVKIDFSYEDGVMKIQADCTNPEPMADCYCLVNSYFQINDFPQDDFTLILHYGSVVYYEGRVNVKDGRISVPYMKHSFYD